ncbi:MAG TPA: DUF2243 domain-containing protein [Allocoleopsis sp.]
MDTTNILKTANVLKTARIAAILIGIGLGGFVDGILLHQILQWHNMLSSVFPPKTIPNLEINMRWDGFFHAATWLITVIGIFMIWHVAHQGISLPGMQWFTGCLLLGWGIFNLVEGIVDHHLLGIHHVKYYPDQVTPISIWDLGFLVVGGLGLMGLGWMLSRLDRPSSQNSTS